MEETDNNDGTTRSSYSPSQHYSEVILNTLHCRTRVHYYFSKRHLPLHCITLKGSTSYYPSTLIRSRCRPQVHSAFQHSSGHGQHITATDPRMQLNVFLHPVCPLKVKYHMSRKRGQADSGLLCSLITRLEASESAVQEARTLRPPLVSHFSRAR